MWENLSSIRTKILDPITYQQGGRHQVLSKGLLQKFISEFLTGKERVLRTSNTWSGTATHAVRHDCICCKLQNIGGHPWLTLRCKHRTDCSSFPNLCLMVVSLQDGPQDPCSLVFIPLHSPLPHHTRVGIILKRDNTALPKLAAIMWAATWRGRPMWVGTEVSH